MAQRTVDNPAMLRSRPKGSSRGSASGTMLAHRGDLATQGTQGRRKILRDRSLTASDQTRKWKRMGGKRKVPCHEDPCGLRLPALFPCGYCYAPKTRTPRTSPQSARRAGKESSAAQTSALDARHGMAKEKHATPHAMHKSNDLLLNVDRTTRRALSAGPRG